ncbi:MAG: hypothetical protein HZB29_07735 [Nitrospinae bacterium]|nr:hypothetical protein [Nitrospinota bacterium]
MRVSVMAPAKTEQHPAWVKLFGYVQAMGNCVISRLVIQDRVPIFMEQSYEDISLSGNGHGKYSPAQPGLGSFRVMEFSPGWSKLFAIATDLVYCEFHDLKFENGAPTHIGKLVNKEKLV